MTVLLFFQDKIYHLFADGGRRQSYRRSVSTVELAIRKGIVALRWKLFRFVSLVTMGKMGGEAYLGNNGIRDLEDHMAYKSVNSHIVRRERIDDAYVQQYLFPTSFPNSFSCTRAFDDAYLYLLSDVIISPNRAAMWFTDGRLLLQSFISVTHFYSFGAIYETLLPVVDFKSDSPVCPLSFHSCYYHQLFEGLLPALRARQSFSDTKYLVPTVRPAYFDGMAAFFGIGKESFVESSCPIRVDKGVLVARRHESGFVRQADVDFLRDECSRRLKSVATRNRKIYISRSAAAARKIRNEEDLERELSAIGFEICHFEAMPFADQMATIHSASIVIAPHGSGEANMIAAQKGTKWIEILPADWFNLCYARLALQLGLDYHYVELVQDESGLLIPAQRVLAEIA